MRTISTMWPGLNLPLCSEYAHYPQPPHESNPWSEYGHKGHIDPELSIFPEQSTSWDDNSLPADSSRTDFDGSPCRPFAIASAETDVSLTAATAVTTEDDLGNIYNSTSYFITQTNGQDARNVDFQVALPRQRWRRGRQRRRRSNSSANRTAKASLTCVYMSHECDRLTGKRFYRLSEIKADALAHAELYQCKKCWKRFGKSYSFTRHTGDERPKYCRDGKKAKGAVPLERVDHEQLRRMTSSKTWHELVDAVSGDSGWRLAYEERTTESNLSRVSTGSISSEITPDNEDDKVSAETSAWPFSTPDYASHTAVGSASEEQWEQLHHSPLREFYIPDANVYSLTYA